MIHAIPPVVPAGRMSNHAQPAFTLPGGYALRPWRTSDAPARVSAGEDPAIRQWNLAETMTLPEAQARIELWHSLWQQEKAAFWAIAQPTDQVVGLIGLGDIDLVGGSAEFVYWLLPEGRGKGLAVEAVLRVSRWAQDDLGLNRLRLAHSVANPASCRVADKAGFALEGTMRRALLHADGWHDQHLHARVTGDAWPQVPAL